jgi:hypothetical protein
LDRDNKEKHQVAGIPYDENQKINTNPISFQNRQKLIMRGQDFYVEMDGYLHIRNSPQGAVPHRTRILVSKGQVIEIKRKGEEKWDECDITKQADNRSSLLHHVDGKLYVLLIANTIQGRAYLPMKDMSFSERASKNGNLLVGVRHVANSDQVEEYVFDPSRHYAIVEMTNQNKGVQSLTYVAVFDPKRPHSPIPMQTTLKQYIDGRLTATRINRYTAINEGIRNSNTPMELKFQPGAAVFDSTVDPMIISIVRMDGTLHRLKSPLELKDRERIIEVTK